MREERLVKAEAELAKIQKNLNRCNLTTKDRVLQRIYNVVPKVVRRLLKLKVEKRSTEDGQVVLHMTVQRDQARLEEAARLDGKFVLATSRLSLDPWETLHAYRGKDGGRDKLSGLQGTDSCPTHLASEG